MGGPLAGADLSGASPAQAAEIDDGVATTDEYQAAFQRFRECVSAAGFELEGVDFTGTGYRYVMPSAAVDDGAEAECYDVEFRYVDMLWQSADLSRGS